MSTIAGPEAKESFSIDTVEFCSACARSHPGLRREGCPRFCRSGTFPIVLTPLNLRDACAIEYGRMRNPVTDFTCLPGSSSRLFRDAHHHRLTPATHGGLRSAT
jgi:hypothetical protein